MDNRNIGLDFLKIISCIGVIIYHVSGQFISDIHINGITILYFGASFCVPMFFLINGYLIFSKKEISLNYLESKIKNFIIFISFWCVVLYIMNFLLGRGNLMDFSLNGVFMSFFSGGYIPVAWFLGTLIIIYTFFVKSLHKLLNHKFSYYLLIMSLLLLLMCSISFLSLYKYDPLVSKLLTYGQTFWLHYYLFFFMLGGFLYKLRELKNYVKVKHVFSILFPLLYSVNLFSEIKINQMLGVLHLPYDFYGSPIYILLIISMFFVSMTVFEKLREGFLRSLIIELSDATMTIYILHLTIFQILGVYIPVNNIFDILYMILVILIMCCSIRSIFKRLPIFHRYL